MELEPIETEELVEEEVDIEALVKRGAPVPKAKRYAFRVDKDRVVVHKPKITGAEILASVGKNADSHKLYQHKRRSQPALVGPHETVDLREAGVERFTTMAKDTTEGRGITLELCREFLLPLADEEYLDALGLPWQTINDGGSQWLLIHDWRVPPGYNLVSVSVALLIPSGYSDTQIDMAYFHPGLSRIDGKGIGALSPQAIRGESWQRWSRHRTGQNPWRPGVDDVANHLALVDEWLRREFERS